MRHSALNKALARCDPWFAELNRRRTDVSERNAFFMEQCHDVLGVPARVVELTGRAGDVVVCHPWLIHSPAMNVLTKPRMIRVYSRD